MRASAITLCLLLAAACATNSGGGGGEPQEREGEQGMVTITGRLTDEGVECQALRGDDGKLYTLTGDLGDFKAGDRVRVTGKVAEVSFCMQGTTLAVATIEKAPSG